jgi:hypothetical protein
METVPRITIRNLLNTYINITLNQQLKNDEWAKSYYLSMAVLKHFLGEEWVKNYTEPGEGNRGFLQPDPTDFDRMQIKFFRSIDLAELLFNLQNIEGFDSCLGRLRGGDIEPTLAELDAARMLYINDHLFWFVEPEGEDGNNFDFRLILPGIGIANLETKCNIERQDISIVTIKNSLNKARSQLPPKEKGIIFIKLPAQWIDKPDFSRQSAQLATHFMRGTDRVVSVKYYAAPMDFVNGRIIQGHRFLEVTSPKRYGENWDLLTNWTPPAGAWNALPRKWVRMVFFAEQNWGPDDERRP